MPEITLTLGSTYRAVGYSFVLERGVPQDVPYEIAARLLGSDMFTGILPPYTPSLFERDPSNIGGENCTVAFDSHTATVSGEVEWCAADESLGRSEGYRVGFAIKAPDDLNDVEGATYTYEGQTGLVVEDTAQNPRELWWYPLATEDNIKKSITVSWNSNLRPAETFIVRFSDVTLQEPDTTDHTKDNTPQAPASGQVSINMPVTDETPVTAAAVRRMSKDELVALAEKCNIDISECRTNPDKAEAIIKALGLESDE